MGKPEKKYKVRKLLRKDRKKLTELITSFANKTKQQNLISMALAGEKDDDEADDKNRQESMASMFELLTEMVKHIEDEITPWFAELIGVSVKEFDTLPFDIDVDIIDQLLDQGGFSNFFLKVSRVRKKIRKLVIQS